MSEEEQPETPPEEQSTAPTPRRPGFFSRLFTAKQVEAPTEEVPAGTPESAEAETDESSPFAAGPAGFNLQPELEDAPAEPVEKKKGIFARFFGKKDAPDAPAEPTEESGEAPAESEASEMAEEEKEAFTAAPTVKKSWFQRLRDRLRLGSGGFIAAIRAAIGLSGKLDEDTVEQLEDILIASDVGMDTTLKIVDKMQKRAKAERIEGADAIMALFRETLEEVFLGNVKTFEPKNPDGPYIVMVTGVNGVGKTTTIGKMAKRCRDAGLSVMLVAGDTFRAAAIEQLEIWAKRTGCEFMSSKPGADPSGLAFDALKAAQARNIDVVFIDTAGRLHTKSSLMDELGKIDRVCKKVIPDAPHETLLVLDATTGQNAIQQVKIFSSAANISGLVMTKLDGTAKGGILITIRDQFDIPVTLIGVGEGVDDLRDFDPEQFARALFSDEGAAQEAS